jgi:serine/threonine protein kinase/Tol biopolymer transport system component
MSTLQAGSRIGNYHVLAPLGAGGMGEVYRARDTKLGRDVALKVVSSQFTADPNRLTRFQREARVLAALNHPNVGQIYGLEESGSVPCLVLELVEGDTLSERLKRGPIPFEEALEISRQIAEGLEAAHERGILHRDLKPANVKLTPDGKVKVLDFGLAKVFEPGQPETDASQSPTLLSAATQPNVLLGTLAYMSPERVRGKEADERSDVWSFGCIFYELLTGKLVFSGDSVADTIGAITKSDPDWSALPSSAFPHIHRLLRRCLEKDRTRRWRHIADVGIEIEDSRNASVKTGAHAVPERKPSWKWLVAGITAGLIVGAVAVSSVIYFRGRPDSGNKMRLEITAPTASSMLTVISPDGRSIVFDQNYAGKSQLLVRPLDSTELRPLPGTEGAVLPFWSSDSRSLGFFANGKLKRIDVAGGPVQVLADAASGRGGAWNPEGTIIFNAASSGPLSRISRDGTVGVATQLQKDQGSHRYPEFLPDGRHFLYYALGKPEVSGVYVGSLDSLESKRILPSDAQAVYASPGYLLYLRQGALLAQPFDVKKLEVSGEPRPLAEHIATTFTGLMQVSAAANGTIAYQTTTGNNARLTWMDRSGKEAGAFGPIAPWGPVDLAMDEARVVTQKAESGNMDLWMIEVARGIATRLTSDPADDEWATWSPDGTRIAFDSNRRGPFDLYQMAIRDIGKETAFVESTQTKGVASWSRDGRYMLFTARDEKTGMKLWVLPLLDKGPAYLAVQRDFEQYTGSLSPDNQWIVYESTDSGRPEIYVQRFSESGDRSQISLEGGADPRWRSDGKEIFYIASDGTLMAATISVLAGGKQIEPGKPIPLFQTNLTVGGGKEHGYAVTRGQRFLLPIPVDKTVPPVTILLNWSGNL